ncbi:MAG: Holliday junction resolvase RuvX [Phenylobacterium sp.]|uniref:Holliday junction resolvase RuvX n=1 Tax=Phenylobacterium sp. TaxID=1871053 RepID=UPI0030192BA0
MPVLDLDDLPSALPRKGALTGVDAGEKTLGVAFCDALWTVATPHSVIRRTKFTDDANALFALMDERGSTALVIGLPLNMDGTEGPRCQSCRALGRNLLRLRPDLLVAFQDERLSTAAVQRTMIQEADLSRGKRAAVVDRAAAAWILDSALDRLRGA